MTDLYLITGFLGAGKTTFLKKFIAALGAKQLYVIVNEFGSEGVDGAVIAQTGVRVNEITGGSVFCSCRLDQFETALEGAVAAAPEIILVEASGLSDPTAIRKVLGGERYRDIRYRGCVCLIDAVRFQKVFATARVCKKQVSVCDLLLVNKTDLADETTLAETETLLREARPDAALQRTAFGEFRPEWLADMDPEAPRPAVFQTKDVGLQRALITLNPTLTAYELERFIAMFVEDTYRVKGFANLEEGDFFVDCVGAMISIKPREGEGGDPNKLVALAGPGMTMRQSIARAAEWYKGKILSVE